MSTFKISINKLTPYEQGRIIKFLDFWKRIRNHEGTILINNFLSEHFLKEKDMDQILSVILQSLIKHKKKLSLANFELLEEEILRLYRRALKLAGGNILCKEPDFVGVVVPQRRLESSYIKKFKNSNKELKYFLEDVHAYCKKYNTEKFLLRDPEFLVWFTWCEKGKSADPFSFVLGSQKFNNPKFNPFIRAALISHLGLGDLFGSTGKLFAFVFHFNSRIRRKTKLFRPTICDAEWNNYFSPPPIFEKKYGLTKPLEKVLFLENKPIETKPVPEGVVRSKDVDLNDLSWHFVIN